LEPKAYNFKGLKNITRLKSGNVYKYLFGSTSNYGAVKDLKAQAESKGYTDSFIVAFKDGEKISLTEALKSESHR